MRISPCRKHRTVFTVPTEHFSALLITNGESFDAAWLGSCALNYVPPIVMTTGSLFNVIIIHVCDRPFFACEACSDGKESEEKSILL